MNVKEKGVPVVAKQAPGPNKDKGLAQMDLKKLCAVLILCVMICAVLGVFAEAAYAQDSDYSQNKGVGDLFKNAKKDEDAGPNQWQFWMGILCWPVTFAVLKWL